MYGKNLSIERQKRLQNKVIRDFENQNRVCSNQGVEDELQDENNLQIRIMEDNCPFDRYEEK